MEHSTATVGSYSQVDFVNKRIPFIWYDESDVLHLWK